MVLNGRLIPHAGLGHEISRVFSVNHPLHVLCTLHGSFQSARATVRLKIIGHEMIKHVGQSQ
eukprot:COSAG06_NODE_18876_length_864_cov_0.912418_2_plen_61_part_01